jgi:hypothetical protein
VFHTVGAQEALVLACAITDADAAAVLEELVVVCVVVAALVAGVGAAGVAVLAAWLAAALSLDRAGSAMTEPDAASL